MEALLLALHSIRILVQNPVLGGGGTRPAETARLLEHLILLVNGGRKTATALKEFAEQIAQMAADGKNPVERDFTAFTDRLVIAQATLAEARKRLEEKDASGSTETPPQE